MSIGKRDIRVILKDLMEAQPHECVCAECGKDLKTDIYVDDELDLFIKVELCPDCTAVSS